ncbi:MAG: UDP-N-acetylmuramoyl-tripeptide--D-alanyl-D-alanine ligase [Syntrophorhabdaceae bacterium]|nr:UDP-N-acetylmuramoyl-tripeptide--D-alanyl-D-alanine ligase [Syntrophorhabdaceae bacterium]
MWLLDEIIDAVKGVPLVVNRTSFVDISTDTRTINRDELFIPLKGKNFDGHRFIRQALEVSGGGGCLCEKKQADLVAGIKDTVILVDDTTQALIDLAIYKRKRTGGKWIAITGSNGKTTTKEILVNTIKKVSSVHYNEKNYNNIIGVSKSILSIKEDCQFYVFELGTNIRGEIKQLATITGPDVSIITNINPSHLEGLMDIEGVLREKLDLFYGTKEGGDIFINADDLYIVSSYRDKKHVVRDYAIDRDASYRLIVEEDLGWEGFSLSLSFPRVSFKAKTRLLGKHNLYNLLAAASIAETIGIGISNIKETIEEFNHYDMRFKPVRSNKGYLVVDDTYNANPSSMEWAIKTVAELPCRGKRLVIIGDMKELGGLTEFYHRELGRALKNSNFNNILLIGESVVYVLDELGEERAEIFKDKETLIEYAKKTIRMDDVVLVKGSRAARMDEIVEALI